MSVSAKEKRFAKSFYESADYAYGKYICKYQSGINHFGISKMIDFKKTVRYKYKQIFTDGNSIGVFMTENRYRIK